MSYYVAFVYHEICMFIYVCLKVVVNVNTWHIFYLFERYFTNLFIMHDLDLK